MQLDVFELCQKYISFGYTFNAYPLHITLDKGSEKIRIYLNALSRVHAIAFEKDGVSHRDPSEGPAYQAFGKYACSEYRVRGMLSRPIKDGPAYIQEMDQSGSVIKEYHVDGIYFPDISSSSMGKNKS